MRLLVKGLTTLAVAFSVVSVNAPAFAQTSDLQLAGTLNGGWSFLTTRPHQTQNWFGDGSAVVTLDNPGFNIQANFGDDVFELRRTAKSPSLTTDIWSAGGDIFWRDYAGSTGINATFSSLAASGTSTSTKGTTTGVDSIGWFGQFFALPQLTLEAKGGRFEREDEGWYGDAGAIFYPYPNLGLNLVLEYDQDLHTHRQERALTFDAEFLPIRQLPVSMYVGYDYEDYSQFSPQQVSVFLVGVKAYLGGGGRQGTLVDYQRNGTTSWDGPSQSLLGLGF